MFKSTFSKFLLTFIILILVGFLLVSILVTSIIKTYVNEEKEGGLISTSRTIVQDMGKNLENVESEMIYRKFVIKTLINIDKELQLIITDANGHVVLSTLTGKVDDDGLREPDISSNLGTVEVSSKKIFKLQKKGEESYLIHRGTLGGYLDESHLACAEPIITMNEVRGYVISLSSTAREDNFIGVTRRVVINSSAWVLLATLIATYFITERIIHPLRNMTNAAKQFGKGKFDTRVAVYGEDEVAELGRAFNNMADSLANLEKMRNSFLANVSHDLRTPMTTISGFIEGITSGAIPPEKQDYYLGIISTEVHRLSRLVTQLLDISRLESGDRKFDFRDFDVAEVGRIILISFEKKLEEKRLDVEFLSDEDSMSAYADKDAIYQVMYNLCHNAIKFSKEGGKFAIKIVKEAGKIRVSVYNEGEGIPEEDLPMVFERFYKSDKSRGLDKSGVGLGLYISKTIIDAHGEKIQVESKEGEYTEFSFTLKAGEPIKRQITG